MRIRGGFRVLAALRWPCAPERRRSRTEETREHRCRMSLGHEILEKNRLLTTRGHDFSRKIGCASRTDTISPRKSAARAVRTRFCRGNRLPRLLRHKVAHADKKAAGNAWRAISGRLGRSCQSAPSDTRLLGAKPRFRPSDSRQRGFRGFPKRRNARESAPNLSRSSGSAVGTSGAARSKSGHIVSNRAPGLYFQNEKCPRVPQGTPVVYREGCSPSRKDIIWTSEMMFPGAGEGPSRAGNDPPRLRSRTYRVQE